MADPTAVKLANGMELSVTYTDAKIEDIHLKTTLANYRDVLLPKLHDANASPKNTPYTRLFRAPLAKFAGDAQHALVKLNNPSGWVHELRKWLGLSTDHQHEIKTLEAMCVLKKDMDILSAQFNDLEKLINQPNVTPEKSITALNEALDKLDGLTEVMNPMFERYVYPSIEHTLLTNLLTALQANKKAFSDQIKALEARVPSQEDIEHLVSIHDRSLHIKSLGTYMAEQLTLIATAGIKLGYELSDNRFNDLMHLPPLIEALSDSKKMLELKAFALDGTEYNDTYSAMPKTEIDTITDNNPGITDTDIVTVSLKPYAGDWNPTELNKLLCLVTEQSFLDIQTPSPVYGLLKVVTSLVEMALLAVELGITLALTVGSLVSTAAHAVSGLSFFNQINEKIDGFHQTLSDFHKHHSPVSWAKKLWSSQYKRKDELQNILDPVMEAEHASYFQLIVEQWSAKVIRAYVIASLKTAWLNIKQIPKDIAYLFSLLSYQAKPEDVYQEVNQVHQQHQHIHDGLMKLIEELSQQNRSDKTVLCVGPVRGVENFVSSPFEVPREVMLTFCDSIVDLFVRKIPGPSTFFFALSTGTFLTYIAPVAWLAWMKSMPMYLQMPTKVISHAFTGNPVAEGWEAQMVATLIEFKLGVVSAEVLMEMKEGNYDLLMSLIDKPEKFCLALTVLISAGMLLKFFPLLPTTITLPGNIAIPNFYAHVFNLFVDEAKSCMEGELPWSSLEFFFLGLKFAMLIHSMVSSSHKHQEHSRFSAYFKAVEQKDNETANKILSEIVKAEESEAIKNFKKHMESLPAETPAEPAPRSPLEAAHQNLLEALNRMTQKDCPLTFSPDPLKDACKYYDHVSHLFDTYNNELQRAGHADLCVNKKALLNVFYNKYCSQDVSNLLCILSIIPGYPLTLAWRGIKWGLAQVLDKPSLAHQVEKQFNKDAVLALQTLAMFARMLYSLSRPISYVLRPVAAIALLGVTALPFLIYKGFGGEVTRKNWFKTIDDWSCKIALHRLNLTSMLKPLYAAVARVAGSNDQLTEAATKMTTLLEEAQPCLNKAGEITTPRVDPSSSVGQIVERLVRAQKNKPEVVEKIKLELGPCWGASARQARKAFDVEPTFFYPNTPNNKGSVATIAHNPLLS